MRIRHPFAACGIIFTVAACGSAGNGEGSVIEERIIAVADECEIPEAMTNGNLSIVDSGFMNEAQPATEWLCVLRKLELEPYVFKSVMSTIGSPVMTDVETIDDPSGVSITFAGMNDFISITVFPT